MTMEIEMTFPQSAEERYLATFWAVVIAALLFLIAGELMGAAYVPSLFDIFGGM